MPSLMISLNLFQELIAINCRFEAKGGASVKQQLNKRKKKDEMEIEAMEMVSTKVPKRGS